MRITGTVLAANGEVAVDAHVRVATPDWSVGTRTDSEGRYELILETLGELTLSAGGGDYGQATGGLSVTQGEGELLQDWSPRLDRGRELSGTLHASDGRALDSWSVEYVGRDGGYVDSSPVGSDGSFTLPNLPTEEGRLFARPSGSPFVLHVVENVASGESHIDVVVPAESLVLGTTTVLPQDADGELRHDVDARMVQDTVGRGGWFHAMNGERLELASPAGSVHMEVGASDVGYVDLETLWILPEGQHELGAVALPVLEPRLVIQTEDVTEGELRLLRTDLAFPSQVADGSADQAAVVRALPLPAGTYELVR